MTTQKKANQISEMAGLGEFVDMFSRIMLNKVDDWMSPMNSKIKADFYFVLLLAYCHVSWDTLYMIKSLNLYHNALKLFRYYETSCICVTALFINNNKCYFIWSCDNNLLTVLH